MQHQVLDAISLEMGRRVARRLREQPSLVGIAHSNLARWLHQNADAPSLVRCYQEWKRLLEGPLPEVCQILESEDEEGRRLRQNSPFAGVLSTREVWAIKAAFGHRHAKIPA
jgi:hypothetical protein